jgi:hypothetical protein
LAGLRAQQRADAHHQPDHFSHAAGGKNAHDQHHQQAGDPGGCQGQNCQQDQDQRVEQWIVVLGSPQPEQDRKPKKQDQAEIWQDRLQHLGDEHGADGQRRAQQEFHIASQV